MLSRNGFHIARLKGKILSQSQSLRWYMSTHNIRRNFIRFFENHDHIHVPSSSVVPPFEDRSLLFTNAGMNQFKSLFLGRADSRWAFLERAVSYQKCIRAGGKHNDLEDVGKDLHHQTFFEMLGNWSFNNAYSKEDACRLAWHFLTDVLSIDPSRLYVTYFGGSKRFNLPSDDHCKNIWLSIGVPKSHILPFADENFWEMGASGPCGPSTEIHYDRVPGRKDVGHLVNEDHSIVELWNIVFISMMRIASGELQPLPSQHIDTGMGLERLASVVQNVPSNFDIDSLTPIMEHLSKMSKKGPYTGKVGEEDEKGRDASYRIVADHMRAIIIALSDGVEPSAVDAGFIVRKMMRRSFWHAANKLKIDRFACAELVPVVVETLSLAYPDLETADKRIKECVAEEEKNYWSVIDKGEEIFEKIRAELPKDSKVFPGEDAFKLHDTHGIPIEITQDLSRAHGLTVDKKRFLELKGAAKVLSQSKSTFKKELSLDTSGLESSDKVKYDYHLDQDGKYVFPPVTTKVLALYCKNNRVNSLTTDGSIVLENCQFYAEEGGQKCDKGFLELDEKPVFEVSAVVKINGMPVLQGKVVGGAELTRDMMVTQKIDVVSLVQFLPDQNIHPFIFNRRMALMRAHTATHLLNWALRRVGAGRGQRGSSIEEDSFRFDYATDDCAGEDDIVENVEALVQCMISEHKPVVSDMLPKEKAAELPMLQSEFREGKEYPAIVRVARIGNNTAEAVAVECCAGTHVLNTSSIVDFTILSDRSLAKGVRRIFALTGEKAKRSHRYGSDIVARLESLSENPEDIAWIEGIDWAQMPDQDHGVARKLIKVIKKKRKAKIASDLKA